MNGLAQEAAHLKRPDVLCCYGKSQPATSAGHIRARQWGREPQTQSLPAWVGKPGQIHSKVSPLNPCHESDCLRQEGGTRGRKRNCKERIPGGQPQTACLVGPALAFLFYPGFSHPPPEPPPQETSPTSSMFTTIK